MEITIKSKRQTDSKIINGKYYIIVLYEDMAKKGINEPKSKT